MQRLGVIGAGRVGVALAQAFAPQMALAGFYSRSRRSATAAARALGGRVYDSARALAMDADWMLVTIPDDALASFGALLGEGPWQGKLFCHCSGSLPASVFFDLKEQGAIVCSLHPIFAFSEAKTSSEALKGATFALEGDEAGVLFLSRFLEGLGYTTKVLLGQDKRRYHLATVLLSNEVVALAALAVELLRGEGFSEREALAALGPLARGNLERCLQAGPAAALSGPVLRGDAGTVAGHLAAMGPEEGDLAEAYRALGRVQQRLADRVRPQIDRRALQDLWEGESNAHHDS